MFATDRDLLTLEPNLFRDVGWLAQTIARGTASLSAGVLTWAGVDLAALGVGPGSVVLFDGVPLEVAQVLSATTARLSLLRASTDDPPIPPANAAARPAAITTFRPQLALAHAQILRMLGIEPDAIPAPDAPGESSITNPGALALLESLGALHLVFGAASAASGAPTPAGKAAFYRDRFAAERHRAAAAIDLDGDGVAEALRRPCVSRLVRA